MPTKPQPRFSRPWQKPVPPDNQGKINKLENELIQLGLRYVLDFPGLPSLINFLRKEVRKWRKPNPKRSVTPAAQQRQPSRRKNVTI